MAEDDKMAYECEFQDCGRVWRSGGDNEGPVENICPDCTSEAVIWGSL